MDEKPDIFSFSSHGSVQSNKIKNLLASNSLLHSLREKHAKA